MHIKTKQGKSRNAAALERPASTWRVLGTPLEYQAKVRWVQLLLKNSPRPSSIGRVVGERWQLQLFLFGPYFDIFRPNIQTMQTLIRIWVTKPNMVYITIRYGQWISFAHKPPASRAQKYKCSYVEFMPYL